jgi:DNA modification methylase
MKTELVKADTLIPYARNPRKNSAAVDKIAASIKEFGWQQPIVVDKENVIIAGHTRLLAAQKLGIEYVPIHVADLSETQAKAYRLADNRLSEDADWDIEMLGLEIRELDDLGFELDLTGFDNNELANLLIDPDLGETDEDAVPEPPEEPISKPGDLWILGEHRLLCGDSTNLEDVERLMDGEQADMVFTDPPWNVNYGSVEKNNAQGYKPRTILNDHMKEDEWATFVSDVCGCLNVASKPGAIVYLVMSAQEWPQIDKGLRDADFHWSSTIIWAKDTLVLSRKDYHTQYEPIWYGWKNGSARLVEVADRKQSDLWEVERPKVSELHPTTKPIELVERAVNNSSHGRDLVLDLFGGSGSTLIACQKNGRKARLMELDPKYCDVIVKRWEDFTGEKATLLQKEAA